MDAAPSTRELQLVCFRMGGEEFGLSIMRIREIIRPLRIARVEAVAVNVGVLPPVGHELVAVVYEREAPLSSLIIDPENLSLFWSQELHEDTLRVVDHYVLPAEHQAVAVCHAREDHPIGDRRYVDRNVDGAVSANGGTVAGHHRGEVGLRQGNRLL